MHKKINQLYKKCKNISKANKKLKELYTDNEGMRKQLDGIRNSFISGMKMLQSEFKHASNALMDEIG